MLGLLLPLAIAGVMGAMAGSLVGLFAGVLLTRIRGGPNDSPE